MLHLLKKELQQRRKENKTKTALQKVIGVIANILFAILGMIACVFLFLFIWFIADTLLRYVGYIVGAYFAYGFIKFIAIMFGAV